MSGKTLPVWSLTPKEEKEAYANWRKSAYAHCNEIVDKFSKCSKQAGVLVTFKCRDLHNEMYSCLQAYQTKDNLDAEYDKIIERKMKASNQ